MKTDAHNQGRMKGLLFSHTFKVNISVVFILLIVCAVMTVACYTYSRNSREALRLSERLLSNASRSVINATSHHLMPAMNMARATAETLAESGIPLPSDERLERHMRSVLARYPQYQMFYAGSERDGFMMVERLQGGKTLTETIREKPARTTRVWRDAKGKELKRASEFKVTYRHRERPWYTGTKEVTRGFWTDIYVFFDDHRPGITASYPIIDSKGTFMGVVGIDIAMAELSDFLETVRMGEGSLALILGGKGEIIARTGGAKIETVDAKDLRFMTVWEMEDPLLKAGLDKHGHYIKDRLTFEYRDSTYLSHCTLFETPFGRDWRIMLLVPEDYFVGSLKDCHRVALTMSIAVLFLAILLSVFLARAISRPIESLVKATEKVKDFHVDEDVNIPSYIREIQSLTDAVTSMVRGLRAFKKYVPAELVRELVRTGEEARLGGRERRLTLFFSDIKDFTGISESMSPRDLMVHLSDYFEEMASIIRDESGTVDKYIGDSVMAFWGAPAPNEAHAVCACRAALRCQDRLAELNALWKTEGKVAFPTRIGMHTGETILGNVGSNDRMNYTVLGDSVNLASRLEALNAMYGTRIIVSEPTVREAEGQFVFRPLDLVAVKGKSEGIYIFELMAERDDDASADAARLSERFAEALELYRQRKWAEALDAFEKVLAAFPHDGPCAAYVARCSQYLENDPGPDWTGVFRMTVK
jgi:adenylate cyclase